MAFQGFLKQATAVDILLGPFLDDTDGKTAETGLTIEDEHVLLSKNGQGLAAKNDANDAAHDAGGYHNCPLDATDTNTVGQLTIACHMTGALPVRLDYHVVEEAVYDAMYGGSAAGPLQSTTAGRTLDVSATGEANANVTHKAGGKYKLTKSGETSGNWSAVGSWEDGVEPVAGDHIIIRDGMTLTLDASATIKDLGQFGTLELQGECFLHVGAGVTAAVLPRDWVVGTNNGTITKSYGYIFNNPSGSDVATNYGEIEINEGAVSTVNYGEIFRNASGATLAANAGVVELNLGTIPLNFGGIVKQNLGTVTQNLSSGVVYGGTVTTNTSGTVYGGTVGTNNGTWYQAQSGDCYPTINTLEFVGNRVKAQIPPAHGAVGGDEFDFVLEIDERTGAVSDPASEETVIATSGDQTRTTTTYTSATVGTQWDVSVSVVQHDPAYDEDLIGDPVITLYSEDEAVQTIDAAGQTHFVAEGEVRFYAVSAATADSPSRTIYTDSVTSAESMPDTYDVITYEPEAGSARENATDAIDTRIAAVGAEIDIYTSYTTPFTGLERNPNCWAADLDLTCISPRNSTTRPERKAHTLISRRHILGVDHSSYYLVAGNTITFVDADDNEYTYTVVSHAKVGEADLHVGLLDSDVDAAISHAKVLPDGWESYFPAGFMNPGQGIPALCLDQEEHATVADIYSLASGVYAACQVPTDETRLAFYEGKISGDSGNPCFLIIDDELVLVTCWTWGGAGAGSAVHYYRDAINAVMADLDYDAGNTVDQTLTEIDLSGFTSY